MVKEYINTIHQIWQVHAVKMLRVFSLWKKGGKIAPHLLSLQQFLLM